MNVLAKASVLLEGHSETWFVRFKRPIHYSEGRESLDHVTMNITASIDLVLDEGFMGMKHFRRPGVWRKGTVRLAGFTLLEASPMS